MADGCDAHLRLGWQPARPRNGSTVKRFNGWINRDPIEEEGGENLYAFCRNNPVLFWDANGCWALIDNAIAAIGGALVGVGCQAISDLIMRETSDWESYVGAAVAGAVMGEILLHNPAMAGATKAIYGGTAAFVGNSVKQFCEVVVSKKQQTFNAQEMAVEVAAGATLAMAPFVKIPGVNRGKGSYLAVARRVNKQFLNRSIKRVSTMTTLRSFTGTAVEYGMAYGMAQPYVTDKVNRGISVFSDMITPADNEIQVIYSELIIIHVVDKCGNVVDVYYVREINSDGQ